MTTYTKIDADQVPDTARFDVPGRHQGQIIEVAYGGFDDAEHDEGDLYERITDRNTGRVTYAVRSGVANR